MISRTSRTAPLLALLALAGCADILGYGDYKAGTGETGSGTGGTGSGTGGGGSTPCEPGATEPCYSGPSGTEDVGVCHGGVRVCKADGSGFDAACVGEVLPGTEDCASPGDEDCDGAADALDAECGCTPEEMVACYAGPPSTEGLGLCKAGTKTCNAQGTAYGACAGEVLPAPEQCDVPGDEDCDGIDGCSGVHRWSEQFGDGQAQGVRSVVVDASGDVFVAGSALGAIDFGGGSPVGGGATAAAYVAKLDPAGKHLWSRSFGPATDQHAYSAAVDGAGAIVIAGDASGGADFGGGPITGAGGYDAFVTKLDASGTPVFGKLYGGAGNQTISGVAVDAAGNILVTGSFESTLDFGCATGALTSAGGLDLFVAKLDGAGACLWQRRYGDAAANQTGSGVAVDAAGDVVVTGDFAGTLDLGGGHTATDPGGGNLFVAKLAGADGASQWLLAGGDAALQHGDAVAVDAAGNVYVTGYFGGTLDLGNGQPGASAGGVDVLFAKIDPGGVPLYAKKFGDAGGQYGEFITVDASGDVLLVANFTGSIDLGSGPLTSLGSFDAAVARFDPQGKARWSRRLGGTGNQTTFGVASDPWGRVHLGVDNDGTADFGGGPLTTAGATDVAVVELAP